MGGWLGGGGFGWGIGSGWGVGWVAEVLGGGLVADGGYQIL